MKRCWRSSGKGTTATFIIALTPEEQRGLPLSLAGFDKGYEALQ